MSKYPTFLHGPDSIMGLPKPYIEYFVRWYYYDNSEDAEIPDTIPVENIEDYIAEYVNSKILFQAKGFVCARNVDEGDNLDFKNDSEFNLVVHYVAKLWYVHAIKNGWIDEDISESEFKEQCTPLRYVTPL